MIPDKLLTSSKRALNDIFSFQPNKKLKTTVTKSTTIDPKKIEKIFQEDFNKDVIFTAEGLRQKRKESPITSEAIRRQANLMQAIIRTKICAQQQVQSVFLPQTEQNRVNTKPFGLIDKTGGSFNQKSIELQNCEHQVFAIKDPDFVKKGAISFFKMNSHDYRPGLMEKFIWDVAVVLGLEKLFTATAITEIKVSGLFKDFKESGVLGEKNNKEWNPQQREIPFVKSEETHELTNFNRKYLVLQGGIQSALKGRTLKEYIRKPHLKKTEHFAYKVAEAILVSFVLSTSDGHAGNFVITDDGEIQLFDNTRSLHHALFINRKIMESTFRCALLDLPESKHLLSQNEIEKLRIFVENLEKNIPKLENYLSNIQTVKQLEKLPSGWVDSEAFLSNMKDRVCHLKKALENPLATNIEKIISLAKSDYNFNVAVSILDHIVSHSLDIAFLNHRVSKIGGLDIQVFFARIKKNMNSNMGSFDFIKVLRKAAKRGFDIVYLKQWCRDPCLTVEEIFNYLKKTWENLLCSKKILKEEKSDELIEKHEQKIEKLKKETKKIIKSLEKEAKNDYKDLPTKECYQNFLEENKESLNKNKIAFMNYLQYPNFSYYHPDRLESIQKILSSASFGSVLVADEKNLTIYYDTETGLRKKNVLQSCEKNMVKVGENKISIEELAENIKYSTEYPIFSDFITVKPLTVKNLLNLTPRYLFLHKNEMGNLVVSILNKKNNNLYEKKYVRAKNGGFVEVKDTVLKIPYTLEEIINLYTPKPRFKKQNTLLLNSLDRLVLDFDL